jgi:predicted nucleic acid-binding Zn ribbon protein
VSRRRAPRRLGAALVPATRRSRPKTRLAAVQEVWPGVAGDAVAAEASPVAERDGTVTIACRSATWAQELDLLQSELLERLNAGLAQADPQGPEAPISALRFTADAARHES